MQTVAPDNAFGTIDTTHIYSMNIKLYQTDFITSLFPLARVFSPSEANCVYNV